MFTETGQATYTRRLTSTGPACGPYSLDIMVDNTVTLTESTTQQQSSHSARVWVEVGGFPPCSNAPPAVAVGGPYSGTEGSPVALAWSATDPDGDALTYQWSFGDGATGSGATPPATHTYADNGSYTLSLTAADGKGGSDTKSTTVTVANAAPVVNAGPDATIVAGQSLAFSGTFSDAGVNDGPWAYTIDWGTGSPTTGTATSQAAPITASRQYPSAGTYTVTLSVTDKDGATRSDGLVLTVTQPVVAISIDVKPGDSRNSISLTDPTSALIPVAVLTTPTFDARLISAASARLGRTAVSMRKNGTLYASLEDVDHDGDLDLVLQFDRAQLIANGDLTRATTQLTLTAALSDGRQARGSDAVRVVP
jgi:PKD repeat protein